MSAALRLSSFLRFPAGAYPEGCLEAWLSTPRIVHCSKYFGGPGGAYALGLRVQRSEPTRGLRVSDVRFTPQSVGFRV